KRLARHDRGHLHHDVDRHVEVVFYGGRAVDLQVRERPFLVEHAHARFPRACDGLRLGARGHRGDQEVVAVHHVVDDAHRRRPLLALEPEDAGPVRLDERTPRALIHIALLSPGAWAMSMTEPATLGVRESDGDTTARV